MPTFTAIDFETAQGSRWSICQVGLVRVEAGVVTRTLDLLVKPPENYFWQSFTAIHGISWRDTLDSPSFADVWLDFRDLIEGQNVVAHNGAFDFTCLVRTLEYYKLPVPTFTRTCTYQIYRKGLAKACEEHGISLSHHQALSDAQACAELYLRHLKRIKAP